MAIDLLQSIINGVLIGAFYALIGMGLNCVYSVMGIITFCQGELLMLGMYISYFSLTQLGLDPYLSIPIVIVVLVILAALMQHFLITPMLKSNNHLNMVFLTIGFSILFQNAAQILWTSNYRTITTAYNKDAIMLGDISINFSKLVSFIVCILIAYGLFVFYKKTTMGKMVRATSLNATGAKLVGIKINWIYLFTFCLGSALAGVAGSLLLPFFYAYPTVGSVFGTRSFAVVMLGGLGNMKGAFIAGILIGILETVSAMFLGSSFQDAVVSIAFLVVLIVRHRMQLRRAR